MLADHRAYATLPTADMDRLRRFYEDTLGFTPVLENPAAVFYGAGEGTTFNITRSTGGASGDHTQLGFRVTGIEAEVDDLRARGVTFEEYDTPMFKTENGIARIGPARAAWFRDPDGNLIGLFEPGPTG
jgi:catechol 2,3-dioxygenase-like lactoylglutathione lyase family enzyme